MVTRWKQISTIVLLALAFAPQLALADVAPPTTLQRLKGGDRAEVLAALAGLIILGFGLMLLAWLGAKATRRYMNREPTLLEKPPQQTPIREKDWAEKPLGKPFEEEDDA
jgi:hypothetical protein